MQTYRQIYVAVNIMYGETLVQCWVRLAYFAKSYYWRYPNWVCSSPLRIWALLPTEDLRIITRFLLSRLQILLGWVILSLARILGLTIFLYFIRAGSRSFLYYFTSYLFLFGKVIEVFEIPVFTQNSCFESLKSESWTRIQNWVDV